MILERLTTAALDGANENLQQRHGLVERKLFVEHAPGDPGGGRIASFQCGDDIVSQHRVAAVFEDIQLHTPPAASKRPAPRAVLFKEQTLLSFP